MRNTRAFSKQRAQCMRSCCEGPIVSQAEVNDGAAEDRNAIGDEQGKVRDTNQQAHQGEIAEHGSKAVGKMKAH